MKTIRGKLLIMVSITSFVILFIGSAVSALSIGKADMAGAIGAGIVIGAVGMAVIDLVVGTTFNQAFRPLADSRMRWKKLHTLPEV